MADEKKPVDGTEEQADEAKTPETELTPETTSDAVVTEEDDAATASASDEDGADTPAGGLEGDETPGASDDGSLPGDDSLSVAGEDSVSGDDTADTAGDETPGDTLGEDSLGDDTLEGDDQIHSAGEAELLAAEEEGEAARAPDEPGENDPAASMHERLASTRAASAASVASAGPASDTAHHDPVVERKSSVVPMVLGGVIAAALGFGASSLASGSWPFGGAAEPDTFREDTSSALSEQTARIDALAAEVQTATDTANGIDLSSLEAAVEALRADLDAASGSYDALAGRIDAIERRRSKSRSRPRPWPPTRTSSTCCAMPSPSSAPRSRK